MHDEDKLLKTMQASFRLEMSERILAISQYIANLEDLITGPSGPSDELTLEAITGLMRELHNLKGAARAVNLPPVEELCHATESLISRFKQHAQDASATQHFLDLLYESTSWGDQLLNRLNTNQDLEIDELHRFTRQLEGGELPAPEPRTSRSSYQRSGVSLARQESGVKISGVKLDELLAASTELLVARLRMRQHREEIAELLSATQSWQRQWRNVRGSYSRVAQRSATLKGSRQDRDMANLLNFVEQNQQRLKQLESHLAQLHARFTRDVSYLSVVTDQVQFETRRLRLIPLATVMEELDRTVRQLSRDLGKQVQLVVYGAELEVDKKLLDELKAPLLHLLRNALDHGLESPTLRLHNGKPANGTISITFRQTGRSIELEVRDDGAGIDPVRVAEMAVQRGLLSQVEANNMDQRTVTQLIFQPGFSTRSEISELSGRGMGLEAVREVANRLGGSIEAESWPGSGTVFRFSVPNVLVTAEGIVVKSAGQPFVLPVDSIERTFNLNEVPLQIIGGRRYLLYNQQQVQISSLSEILGLPAQKQEPYIVLLQSRGHFGAFLVNELLRNQEVVVKNLSKPLLRVRHVSGATIMADGQVALILNTDDLIRSGASARSVSRQLTQAVPASNKPSQQRILIVDDSITTRTLEKNILEAAGFYVQTSRNGLEALNQLRSEEFDLVISDLEMPIMDGFQLTGSIKRDPRLNETPVIIVTSLDSPTDKSRGMEAGADAYVVKNRFDQQGLLTTIRQLI